MAKLFPKKSLKTPAKAVLTPADPRFVGSLYADLGFDQRTIARLAGASIGSVERIVKARKLVRSQPLHGEWNEGLVRDLASRLGITLPNLDGVKPGDVWVKLRVALQTEVPKALARDPTNRLTLAAFFAALPARQKAANARLTRARLAFLHGDLGMQVSEIARVLDTSWASVRDALAREKLHRNHLAHPAFKAFLPRLRRSAREGLLAVAATGPVDLAALDLLLDALASQPGERVVKRPKAAPAKATPPLKRKAA